MFSNSAVFSVFVHVLYIQVLFTHSDIVLLYQARKNYHAKLQALVPDCWFSRMQEIPTIVFIAKVGEFEWIGRQKTVGFRVISL